MRIISFSYLIKINGYFLFKGLYYKYITSSDQIHGDDDICAKDCYSEDGARAVLFCEKMVSGRASGSNLDPLKQFRKMFPRKNYKKSDFFRENLAKMTAKFLPRLA